MEFTPSTRGYEAFVAVTTATVLGVETPVMGAGGGAGVEAAAGLPDPPQPDNSESASSAPARVRVRPVKVMQSLREPRAC
jgi:hypothetical protein